MKLLVEGVMIRATRCVVSASALLGIGVLAIALSAPPAYATPSFITLGTLGSGGSLAHAVSADGSIVVGRTGGTADYEAFRWTGADGMEGLGDLPGGEFDSRAEGVSDDGSTIVGRGSGANGLEAFRWTRESGTVGLGHLVAGAQGQAADASADGSMVVGSDDSRPFLWTADTGMVALGIPARSASAITPDGSTIAGSYWVEGINGGTRAFRWTSGGGMVGLGDLPGGDNHSNSYDISDDGSTVVGLSNSTEGYEAFRWTSADGMVGLGDLAGGGFYSVAHAVSADGSIIVGAGTNGSSATYTNAAFIWDATNGMRDLNQVLTELGLDLMGLTLYSATGISADGSVIVGNARTSDYTQVAWRARIPEPTTGTLFAMGLLFATATTRRRAARSPGLAIVRFSAGFRR